MRHRVSGKKLNRDIKHRKALFKNLISALIIHEEIQTTESKAKAIKGLTDKLISRGKKGTLQARRAIAAFLQDKTAVNKIVDDLGPRFKNRVSGFTRIIRLGKRRGDDAVMVKMEFVEKGEVEEMKKEKMKEKKKGKEKKELKHPDKKESGSAK
jgi:large subunit ribosomal protein L17